MTEYREILRLYNKGISQRAIAESLSCSCNTVAKVLQRAKEQSTAWPLILMALKPEQWLSLVRNIHFIALLDMLENFIAFCLAQ